MPPSRSTAMATASSSTSATQRSSSSKAAKAKAPSTTSEPARPAASASTSAPLPASFSRPQASKAVTALLAHSAKAAKERESTELISREEHVWLCISLKTGSTKKKVMPVRVQLPHPPLPPPPATSVCLIVKDPQREYKDLLAAQDIKFVSRVVGLEKLKGKFKPFEARRALMREHELFLADERVMGLMPQLLGKVFYDSKKVPIAVNLKHKNLKNELAQAIASTYLIPNTGTNVSVRIATISSSSADQTLENLLAAIPRAVSVQKGGWDNILSLGIKTSTSVLLPIWNAPVEGRFDHAAAAAAEQAAEKEKRKSEGKRKNVFELYAEEEREDERRAKIAAGEAVDDGPVGQGEKVKKGSAKKKAKSISTATAMAIPESEVKAKEAEPAQQLEKEEVAGMTSAGKASDKAAKAGKKSGKKSSTIGSGGAGKKAKEGVLGRAR